MAKKGKVTGADYLKAWTNAQGKVFHIFGIRFDNGDYGEAFCNANPQTDWVIGQDTEYEITPSNNPQYAAKIKKAGGGSGFGGGRAKTDPKTMFASYSKDLVVACINAGKTKQELNEWQDIMFKLASNFEKWYNGEEIDTLPF